MSDEILDNPAESETSVPGSKESSTKAAKGIRELLEEHKEESNEANVESDDSESDGESGTEETDEETETEDEEETEEEEVEEKEEEEEETEAPELNASFGNLKKEYPDIFKKFPGLRNKLGREYAYSEIYSTVEEAKISSKKAEVFDYFDQEITKGNPVAIVGALPNAAAAVKFAENILPTLRSVDPSLFQKAVDPFVRMMLNKIDSDATGAKDENLGRAVKYIARYLYGKPEVPSLPTRRSEPDPEKEELLNRLQRVEEEKVNSFSESLDSRVYKTLDKEAKALFDPKNTLSPKAQEVWVDRILKEVDEELSNNASHMAKIRAFREKALNSGLNKEHQTRILSAYLANARPVLRSVSQRIKTEAFGKRSVKETTENRTEGRKVIPSSSGINKTPSKAIPGGFKDVKSFKAKGGRMEDILGG